jgi:hypothetical protein
VPDFRDLTLADALAVTSHMRQVDRGCLHTVGFITDPEQLAIYHWQGDGPAWTFLQDGEPAAIGGVRFINEWTGVVWMVGTDRLARSSWKKLLRHGRIVLGNSSKRLRRVESYVLKNWTGAHSFAVRAGFELEGVRQGAGRDGEDILTMVYRGQRNDEHL